MFKAKYFSTTQILLLSFTYKYGVLVHCYNKEFE